MLLILSIRHPFQLTIVPLSLLASLSSLATSSYAVLLELASFLHVYKSHSVNIDTQ